MASSWLALILSLLPHTTVLRQLRKAMERHMPEGIKEEQELIPGGDLRIAGNAWLRQVWVDAGIARVPREAEVRKVVKQLAHRCDICSLV